VAHPHPGASWSVLTPALRMLWPTRHPSRSRTYAIRLRGCKLSTQYPLNSAFLRFEVLHRTYALRRYVIHDAHSPTALPTNRARP
jgi:hypothetical protein